MHYNAIEVPEKCNTIFGVTPPRDFHYDIVFGATLVSDGIFISLQQPLFNFFSTSQNSKSQCQITRTAHNIQETITL